MRIPSRLYYVVVLDRSLLRWSERGSKTYSSKDEALRRIDNLCFRGVPCELYESEPLVWNKISTAPVLKGQDPLW